MSESERTWINGPDHGRGGMRPAEKAKDFKGSDEKTVPNYMRRYKLRFVLVLVFAIARNCIYYCRTEDSW